MPQETQQKTFKFVKSSRGEINFRVPLYGESDQKKKPVPGEFRPSGPKRTH